jgi:glycosyltransferase involved in cell wall biosynthesis
MTLPQTPRRALLLTYHDPQCTNYGAGQRTHFLLKALGQYATTDVVLLSETDSPNTTTDLPAELGSGKLFHLNYVPKNLLDRTWCGLPSKWLSTLLINTIDFGQYDCIVCRYITPYLKFNLPGNKPLIIDFDDPIYSISWSLLNSPRAILKEAVKWLNQRIIRARLKTARLKNATFLFVCERDQKAFPQLKGGLLSNMPAFPQHPADYSASDGKTLLFVGFMSWQPNIIAVDYFLAHIWPKILAKNPSAQFRIVGKSTPENLKRWNTFPNCIAEGYAENIDAAYKNAAICVVPVLSGGGSNIKVPEAMAHNRPVVVSVYAFNGWRNYFVENQDLLVAFDDDAFAAHCTALLTDRELALKLAHTGHHSVLRKLSFDSFAKQVGYTLQPVFSEQTQ